jgi:hypothetical protein
MTMTPDLRGTRTMPPDLPGPVPGWRREPRARPAEAMRREGCIRARRRRPVLPAQPGLRRWTLWRHSATAARCPFGLLKSSRRRLSWDPLPSVVHASGPPEQREDGACAWSAGCTALYGGAAAASGATLLSLSVRRRSGIPSPIPKLREYSLLSELYILLSILLSEFSEWNRLSKGRICICGLFSEWNSTECVPYVCARLVTSNRVGIESLFVDLQPYV